MRTRRLVPAARLHALHGKTLEPARSVNATMRIDLTPDPLLSTATRQRIDELSDTVYPPGSAPDWAAAPIRWAPQTIRAMIWDEERLICHVGALVRSALLDGRAVPVGGIGGVMTAPARRRQGHARAALTAMRHHLIDERQVAFSLLFCAADLHPFYGQLGWKLFAGTPPRRAAKYDRRIHSHPGHGTGRDGSRASWRPIGTQRAAMVTTQVRSLNPRCFYYSLPWKYIGLGVLEPACTEKWWCCSLAAASIIFVGDAQCSTEA